MWRYFVDTFGRTVPQDGEFELLNRFQYRALKPTWPVAFSILFLSVAFLLAGQGRAIIKLTASEPDWYTPALITLHSVVMMYTAFMLSAVSRRAYVDMETAPDGTARTDPVDPSIPLRMRYAYLCGIFLPLLFMLMSLWFEYGLFNPLLCAAAAIGALAALIYGFGANAVHRFTARQLAPYNRIIPNPTAWQQVHYRLMRVTYFFIDPESRIAQSLIVLGAVTLAVLWIFSPVPLGHETYLTGAFVFFGCILLIHLLYRLGRDRVVRLHHGHAARYIVIDPNVSETFRWIRRIGIVAIPVVFWIAPLVDALGPLGVGLFGTLWVTLFFSGLVESSARHARADSIAERDREHTTFSMKSLFLLFLIGLLLVELAVNVSETLLFRPALTVDVLFAGALLAGVVLLLAMPGLRRRQFSDFRYKVNRLPSSTVLAPILLLSFGEAHHIHRLDLPAEDAPAALSLDNHARAWLAARSDEAGPIPAIVVLAEGGGIRAGAHTGYYLSALDDALRTHCQTQDAQAPRDPMCRFGPETRLADHLYIVSGVSGGAVGSAVYLAAVAEENRLSQETRLAAGDSNAADTLNKARDEMILAALSEDYLSPLFAGMFGSDLLSTIIPAQLPDRIHGLADKDATDSPFTRALNDAFAATPLPVPRRGLPDRADFFEHRLASVFDAALRDVETRLSVPGRGQGGDRLRTFDLPLEQVARATVSTMAPLSDPGPIVLFSTFYETGGFQMAAANVDIMSGGDGQNCGAVPIVQQMLGRTERFESEVLPDGANRCARRQKTLPLSTAAHLSARFPVSNPTGVLETRYADGRWKRHFFVDGGYMDNSGALAALPAIDALRSVAGDREINVIVLHLYALGIPEHPNADSRSPPVVPRATKQTEFTAIPSAILKARGAASRAPVQLLCGRLLTLDAGIDVDACDDIFRSRQVTSLKARTVYSPDDFRTSLDERCLTDRGRIRRIPLTRMSTEAQFPLPEQDGTPEGEPAENMPAQATLPDAPAPLPEPTPKPSKAGIMAASWIPMPLEIAVSDRQDNAIQALLGWALLRETTDNIRQVSAGAADQALVEFAGAIAETQANCETGAAGCMAPIRSRCAPQHASLPVASGAADRPGEEMR